MPMLAAKALCVMPRTALVSAIITLRRYYGNLIARRTVTSRQVPLARHQELVFHLDLLQIEGSDLALSKKRIILQFE